MSKSCGIRGGSERNNAIHTGRAGFRSEGICFVDLLESEWLSKPNHPGPELLIGADYLRWLTSFKSFKSGPDNRANIFFQYSFWTAEAYTCLKEET